MKPAGGTRFVLVAFSAAELEPRLTCGLGRGKARANEIRGTELLMMAELGGHLGFDLGPAAHGAQERTGAGSDTGNNREHQVSWGVAASERAIACANRFQLIVSAPSRFRPRAVRW
jgi:hypothetical protein